MDIDRYRKIIAAVHAELQSVPEEITTVKLTDQTWSLKEIVGHLVDSASNNHQRFVRLQDTAELVFPPYDQNIWNAHQNFNEFPWYDLIQLWTSYNKLLLHIIQRIDPAAMTHVWYYRDRQLSLEWIINDYYRHVQHHFDQLKQRSEEIQKMPL